ncbi:DUF4260 domain-containing protein [Maritimibacter dapengensis]|nr:DUF4260 domain-containing protein [Maritimibacter dapengensis]
MTTMTTNIRDTDRAPLEMHQIAHLRIEGAVQLGLALALFASTGASWWLFAALILAPDLSALGYLANTRIGGWCYNLGHSYVGPAALLAIGYVAAMPMILALGAIWWAHIGMDRAVGYGFKSLHAFKRTHLSF